MQTFYVLLCIKCVNIFGYELNFWAIRQLKRCAMGLTILEHGFKRSFVSHKLYARFEYPVGIWDYLSICSWVNHVARTDIEFVVPRTLFQFSHCCSRAPCTWTPPSNRLGGAIDYTQNDSLKPVGVFKPPTPGYFYQRQMQIAMSNTKQPMLQFNLEQVKPSLRALT